MKIQELVALTIRTALEGRDVTRVAWVAAGGSYVGLYAANFFVPFHDPR